MDTIHIKGRVSKVSNGLIQVPDERKTLAHCLIWLIIPNANTVNIRPVNCNVRLDMNQVFPTQTLSTHCPPPSSS